MFCFSTMPNLHSSIFDTFHFHCYLFLCHFSPATFLPLKLRWDVSVGGLIQKALYCTMVFLCEFVWALGSRGPPVWRVVLLRKGQRCSRTGAWPKVACEEYGAIPSISSHCKATSQDLRAPVCPQTITADLSMDDIFICHRPKVLNTFPLGAEGERKKTIEKVEQLLWQWMWPGTPLCHHIVW